jgi:peptide deformylase
MAVFPIRTFGDPVLRQRAAEISAVDDQTRKLMHDMMDTIQDVGVGLAAPQIGVLRRVIVWRYDGDRGALANPRILEAWGAVEGEEACLSLPGIAYPVVRAERVLVEGLSDRGKLVKIRAEDWTARILQHEIDHLNGVLFIDRLAPEHQREARRRLRQLTLGGPLSHEPAPAL